MEIGKAVEQSRAVDIVIEPLRYRRTQSRGGTGSIPLPEARVMNPQVSKLMQHLRQLPAAPVLRHQLEDSFGYQLVAELDGEGIFTAVGDREPDREATRFSVEGWWAMIQRKLDLPPECPLQDPVVEHAWYLGQQSFHGLERDVLVIMGEPSRFLAMELQSIR